MWVCEGSSAASEDGSGSTVRFSCFLTLSLFAHLLPGQCVVHGGHTHGECSSRCNGIDLGEYDQDLHIVALFIVLISSLVGVLLPLFSASLMSKKLFSSVFFAAKHLYVPFPPSHRASLTFFLTNSGTGVIISTAFVHLLYHSFIMFANTCLGELAFEPAAAAISMAGMYVSSFSRPFILPTDVLFSPVQLRRLRGRLLRHEMAQGSL